MEKLLQDLSQVETNKKKTAVKANSIIYKDDQAHEGVDNFFKKIALKNKESLEEFNKYKTNKK